MPESMIYIIDDQQTQRDMLEWDLRDLFGSGYLMRALPVHEKIDDYFMDLNDPSVLGLLIDQRLNESGESIGYSGVDLARHLRSVFPEMPIFLITGYDPDDQMKGAESGAVDAVVHKSEFRAGSPLASRFKERFLRQAKRYEESLAEWQKRFRELLRKKVAGDISEEEASELSRLEAERLLPTQAAEDTKVTLIEKQITALEAVERMLEKLPQQ